MDRAVPLPSGDAKETLDARPFDDFLGLGTKSFRNFRLIVFCGISGSGKSRYLNYLAEQHPDFEGREKCWIDPFVSSIAQNDSEDSLVLIDEIRTDSQLVGLRSLLQRGNTVAVASHVQPWRFWSQRLFWPSRCFRTDRSAEKISRFLEAENVVFSRVAVDHFCHVFGANYLDACHIMERYPDQSFDDALQRFLKFCGMHQRPEQCRQSVS